MTINIICEIKPPFSFHYKKLAEKVIIAAMDAEDFPYEAEVNLTLVDNERIREINADFRQIDRATDVLSFPLISYEKPGDFCHRHLVADWLNNYREEKRDTNLGAVIEWMK